ncbi:hypothetical protein EVAR_11839_1 [Eumeta japonica]|uniref:Reverse transcriptase domain-containing protein n=1 Tax=Eumeta variegata TaxID=151549 RepID=A0A4C1YPB3_EUMVA|nr:hypothetical protein EVAR_11839_1 [Eumeta japonica]
MLRSLYNNITMSLQVQNEEKPIQPQAGVKQGDGISSKLFTSMLKDSFKLLNCEGYDINMNDYFTHHLSANGLDTTAESMNAHGTMVGHFAEVSQ